MRFYLRYTAIPLASRRQIEATLDLTNGWMVYWAKQSAPPAVLALRQGRPIGWAICAPRGTWSRWRRTVMVFVLPEHRRQGIGRALIERLYERCNLFDKNVSISDTHSKQAKRFFRALGFVTPTPRNETPHRTH